MTGSRYESHSVQQHARRVRPHLPPAVFRPVPGRLLWLPVHLAIIVGLGLWIVCARPPWWAALAGAVE